MSKNILKYDVKADSSDFQNKMGQCRKELTHFEKVSKNVGNSVQSMGKNFQGLISNIKGGNFGVLTEKFENFGDIIKGGSLSIEALSLSFSNLLNPITLTATAIAGLGIAMKKGFDTFNQFDTEARKLQALTGATIEAKEQFILFSKELSQKYSFGGDEILKSFSVIGSQLPQLLKDSKALKDVTEGALLLSTSSGGTLSIEESAKSLSTIINQFKLDSSEYEKVVNLLASGSQQGSYGVTELSKAIEKSGSVAKNAGLSYVELASIIEGVGTNFSSAEELGTALKGTLLKLETSNFDKLKPSVVGLEQALNNLSNAGFSTQEMTKLFGESNIIMANSLINNKDAIISYTKSLEGTNTAIEQANILQGSFEEKSKLLSNSFTNLWQSIGNTDIVQSISKIFSMIGSKIKDIIDYITDLFDSSESGEDFKIFWEVLDGILTTISGIIKIIISAIAILIKSIKNIIEGIIKLSNDFYSFIENGIKNIKVFANKIISISKPIKKVFDDIKEYFFTMVKRIVKLWDKFLEFIGFGKKKKLQIEVEKQQQGNNNNSYINDNNNEPLEKLNLKVDKPKKDKKIKVEKEIILKPTTEKDLSKLDFNKSFGIDNYLDRAKKKIELLKNEIQDLITKQNYLVKGSKEWEAIQSQVDSKNKEIEKINKANFNIPLPTEKKDGENDNLDNKISQVNIYTDSILKLGEAFGNLTQSTNNNILSWINWGANIIQTITSLIPKMVALQTVKNIGSGGILGIISGIGGLFGAVSSIPKFANGGIVGGTSYQGDKILARLNSGEGVLTKQGLSNLNNIFSNNNQGTLNGNVRFEIQGSKLFGVLENYKNLNKL